VAGFISELDGVIEVSGLFTSSAPNLKMVERGRFYGQLEAWTQLKGAISFSFDS
jgi:hypothetical protein